MPLTPAHVAAVLPLRGRWNLPFAALAAGSMSPDLGYFLPFSSRMPRHATHSVVGIVTWDLLFGVAMWLVWRWAVPPCENCHQQQSVPDGDLQPHSHPLGGPLRWP